MRERLEAEHELRQAAFERRRSVEARMDSYRTGAFTPSGRPYESLPVVSIDTLRNELRNNRKGLLSGATTWGMRP